MTPWGFFPVSDVYSVVPKWEESHAVTADVIYDDDAPNYYALVCDLEATESSFVITMMDTSDPENPVPPADTAIVSVDGLADRGLAGDAAAGVDPRAGRGRLGRRHQDRHLTAHAAVDRAPPVRRFMMDVILPTEPDRPYRMAYGTMAVRR